MKNNAILIGVVVLLIVLVGGYLALISGPTVSAQGTSEIKVVPDEVSVNINIQTHNDTAKSAQEANKAVSDQLLIELIKLGFDKSELNFANYNIYPEYDYSRNGDSKIIGYVVYQEMVVKTSDVEKVPSIVDAAVRSGALISYINFEISSKKQSEIKAQALNEASRNAKIQAEAIVQGQGKKLGSLVSIQNQEVPIFRPYETYSYGLSAGVAVDKAAMEQNAVEATKAATNLSPQEQTISATVLAEYKISRF
jgi:uncharacterized protein YggE